MSTQVTAFYDFFFIDEQELPSIREIILSKGKELNLRGLLIIGTEGCNSTLSGSPDKVSQFKQFIVSTFPQAKFVFKDSFAGKKPFKRFKVDIRDEIVTLNREFEDSSNFPSSHLSPEQWEEVLEKERVTLIDTRNTYETELGSFEGAITPDLNAFTDFHSYLDEANIPKDEKVLMFCTGGIRCEKASQEMFNRGYQKVYQLEGGILAYLEKFPDRKFKGECFVFDDRVAVDQELKPSKRYKLCPHCGDPGDLKIACDRCGKPCQICEKCEKQSGRRTCSKDCRFHFLRLKQAA